MVADVCQLIGLNTADAIGAGSDRRRHDCVDISIKLIQHIDGGSICRDSIGMISNKDILRIGTIESSLDHLVSRADNDVGISSEY